MRNKYVNILFAIPILILVIPMLIHSLLLRFFFFTWCAVVFLLTSMLDGFYFLKNKISVAIANAGAK